MRILVFAMAVLLASEVEAGGWGYAEASGGSHGAVAVASGGSHGGPTAGQQRRAKRRARRAARRASYGSQGDVSYAAPVCAPVAPGGGSAGSTSYTPSASVGWPAPAVVAEVPAPIYCPGGICKQQL